MGIDARADQISFTLNGSAATPVHNVCFVIQNWNDSKGAGLQINDKKIALGKDFRQGLIYDTNGKETLLIWCKLKSTKGEAIHITKEI